jgi:hypothetical protein
MNEKKRKVSKVLLVGGAVVLTGAIFLGAKTLLKKKESESQDAPEDIDVNINVSQATSAKSLPSGNDNFPLRYGSIGNRVKQLQEAIKKIIGDTAMSQYTRVDGDFRTGTENALKAAKLPTVIDEVTFNKLVGNSSSGVMTLTSPAMIGIRLYSYATAKNFDGVISMLKQLNTVSDYSAASKAFISQQMFSVAQSIVTYLLDTAFKYNIGAKTAIRSEFLRMGLKSTANDPVNEDGKWSLAGFTRYRDIITLTDTYVTGTNKKRIAVKRKTILGEETAIRNGMTFFKALDGKHYAVPTAHVKYSI